MNSHLCFHLFILILCFFMLFRFCCSFNSFINFVLKFSISVVSMFNLGFQMMNFFFILKFLGFNDFVCLSCHSSICVRDCFLFIYLLNFQFFFINFMLLDFICFCRFDLLRNFVFQDFCFC